MSAGRITIEMLNEYSIPKETLERNVRFLNIAEKVCAVVALALLGVALYYAGIAITLAVICAVALGTYLSSKKELKEQTLFTTKELDKIKDWDDAKITKFLTDNNYQISDSSMEALKQKDSNRPLKAILPIIATLNRLYGIVQRVGLSFFETKK